MRPCTIYGCGMQLKKMSIKRWYLTFMKQCMAGFKAYFMRSLALVIAMGLILLPSHISLRLFEN